MSTPITHSLSIAITTVLIFGLIFAANGYLDDQRDAGARQQVETIGTDLVAQLEETARLGSDSQQATLRVDQPGTVMSNTYSVALEPEGECTLTATANACLVVDVSQSGENLVREFPVNNASDVHVSIERLDSRTFTLAATRTGTVSTESNVVPIDQTLQIGVGADVDPSGGDIINPFNRPPIAKFTFEPGFPDSDDDIEFDASNSRDPDGTIEAYHWIINGTNITKSTGSMQGDTYSTTLASGENNVTLKVVDDEGGVGIANWNVSVSGLVYDRGSMSTNPSCNKNTGPYKIVNVETDKVLEVEGGGDSNGDNIQQGTYDGSDSQHWNIVHESGGSYRISPVNAPAKAMDVEGASDSNGANVLLWEYHGSDNQLWNVQKESGGEYVFVAEHSDKYLDVKNGNPNPGTNVRQWEDTDTDAQRWKTESVSSGGSGGKCVGFTIENTWSSEITITHVLLDTDANYLERNHESEVMFDIGQDGTWDQDRDLVRMDFTSSKDGTVVSIDPITLQAGETADVEIRGLRGGGNPIKTRVGLRYLHDGTSKRTIFEDS